MTFAQNLLPDVVENHVLLAVVAVLATCAVAEVCASARTGPRSAKPAKVALVTSLVFLAFSYWAEILHIMEPEDCQDLRRITSPALYLSIIWTTRAMRLFWQQELKNLRNVLRGRQSGG